MSVLTEMEAVPSWVWTAPQEIAPALAGQTRFGRAAPVPASAWVSPGMLKSSRAASCRLDPDWTKVRSKRGRDHGGPSFQVGRKSPDGRYIWFCPPPRKLPLDEKVA